MILSRKIALAAVAAALLLTWLAVSQFGLLGSAAAAS